MNHAGFMLEGGRWEVGGGREEGEGMGRGWGQMGRGRGVYSHESWNSFHGQSFTYSISRTSAPDAGPTPSNLSMIRPREELCASSFRSASKSFRENDSTSPDNFCVSRFSATVRCAAGEGEEGSRVSQSGVRPSIRGRTGGTRLEVYGSRRSGVRGWRCTAGRRAPVDQGRR